MQEVLSLIAAGGGSGGGLVQSVTLPLSISGAGVLQIDLSTYLTSAQTNSLLASYTTTAGINTLLANYVLASSLYNGNSIKLQDANGTTRLLSASQTGALVWNAAQLVDINDLATSLAAKQDTLVAGTGIAIAGNTISASGGGAVSSATAPLSISSSGVNVSR